MMFRPHLVWIVLFVGFILEGSLMPWLLVGNLQTQITPFFVLILLMFFSLEGRRHLALGLGLLFGFFHDILYFGHMIGLYTSVMGLTAYLIGLLAPLVQRNFTKSLIAVAVGILFASFLIYFVYTAFRIIDLSLSWVLLHRILPTLVFNLIVAIVCYLPIRAWLNFIDPVKRTEKK